MAAFSSSSSSSSSFHGYIVYLVVYAVLTPFMFWIILVIGRTTDSAGGHTYRAYWVPSILKREVCLWPVWLVVFLAPAVLWPVLMVAYGVYLLAVWSWLMLFEIKGLLGSFRMLEDDTTCCGRSLRRKRRNGSRDVEMGTVHEQPIPAPPAEVKAEARHSSAEKSEKSEATAMEVENNAKANAQTPVAQPAV